LWLVVIAVAITAASAIARILENHVITGDGADRAAVEILDVNRDQSVATYYTVSLLVVASLMSVELGNRKDGGSGAQRYWAGIAVALAVLAMEEAVGAVSEVGDAVGSPAVAAATVVAMALATRYPGFLRRIGPPASGLLVAAAVVYSVGGLGLEAVAKLALDNLDLPREGLVKAVEQHVEELAEMVGISICIQALAIRLAGPSTSATRSV
jgi:hypothetical protein